MAEMTKLRVNEAIARAQTAGIKVYKRGCRPVMGGTHRKRTTS